MHNHLGTRPPDYIYERNTDLFAVTESWLTVTDAAVKFECSPDGYKMFSTSRQDRKGGAIALICRSNMTVREVDVPQRSSFEICEWRSIEWPLQNAVKHPI